MVWGKERQTRSLCLLACVAEFRAGLEVVSTFRWNVGRQTGEFVDAGDRGPFSPRR